MFKEYPNATTRPNPDELEGLGIHLKGIKIICACERCSNTWALWFRSEKDLSEHLNPRWFYCSHCDGEVFPDYE
jgi:hypothetical protein